MDQLLEALGGPFHMLLRWFLHPVASFSTLVAFPVSPVATLVSPVVALVSLVALLFLLAQGQLVSWVS